VQTVSATRVLSPTSITALTTIPSPVTSAGSTALPVTVAALTALPAPTAQAGSTVTVTPVTITAQATVPPPQVTAPSSVTGNGQLTFAGTAFVQVHFLASGTGNLDLTGLALINFFRVQGTGHLNLTGTATVEATNAFTPTPLDEHMITDPSLDLAWAGATSHPDEVFTTKLTSDSV
jgi:hypothetical protein